MKIKKTTHGNSYYNLKGEWNQIKYVIKIKRYMEIKLKIKSKQMIRNRINNYKYDSIYINIWIKYS